MNHSWREFWNGDHAIYVNDLHKLKHAEVIMGDMLTHIAKGDAVLDFGCGETPLLDHLAEHSCQLILCDGASSIVDGLKQRIHDKPQCTALAPEDLSGLKDNSLDKIFVVSVVQYLSHEELKRYVAMFKRILKPNGKLYLADILSPAISMLDDVKSLLSMAYHHGFLLAALSGLVRTALSSYSKLRTELGLTRFSFDALQSLLQEQGFTSSLCERNIGPHQHRFTLVATKIQP